ncbi:uncharacterized protein TOT_020000075 [Theileria orientalis strain Shintoku]|uniref:WW domain-containing protein n=1 Tax=Theileria orientalis strain Shintoku TaxID=869250 RepID=J4DNZ2_THEOR|nr:uncharacterized protein TOT_020000075 [Theileria orientalis strain Shintoku]BAM39804.1 uncharacterized protein TOT_020000075 [Theileria orientalis strain Shintoku]|eukprot:XP_009690105.1 uncharacterized protein TOT_020000075 [Theileria orientalis strain Shintoku]
MDKTDVPNRIWKEVIDPSSRSIYYWNVLTGETTWQNPSHDDAVSLPFTEKISHDSKVVIDKLTHKVDRIKFFFDEINLIHEVCDHLRNEEIGSIKELIEHSLDGLNQLLEVATPKTKSYNKFLDLKKFLTEQRSYLKNNSDVSDEVFDRINDVSEEIERNLETIKKFDVNNDHLLDGYKVYMEKRKLEPINQPDLSIDNEKKVSPNQNLDYSNSKDVKVDKKSILKSIHERWNRASEIIDEPDSEDVRVEYKKTKGFSFVNTDEDNPNLVPISKPWYEKDD